MINDATVFKCWKLACYDTWLSQGMIKWHDIPVCKKPYFLGENNTRLFHISIPSRVAINNNEHSFLETPLPSTTFCEELDSNQYKHNRLDRYRVKDENLHSFGEIELSSSNRIKLAI